MQYKISLVIPVYNEQDSITPLLEKIDSALVNLPYPWQAIIIDDGSSDNTLAVLQEKTSIYGDHIKILALRRNFGQSAAMQAGIDEAQGDFIVTLDGDLQNDPQDIPRMLQRVIEEDLDLLSGWRKARQDTFKRRFPSMLANILIGKITGVKLHDYGCSLKVYRTEVLRYVRLYGEMHRFLPAWISKYTAATRIKEEIVTHHARSFGQSKYGIARTFRVLVDLLSVWFFLKFSAKPGHFFGGLGLFVGSIGTIILTYLLIIKLMGNDIGSRPLLLVGILLLMLSAQFLTTGVLSELLTRIYHQNANVDLSYIIKQKYPSQSSWKE